MYVCVYIYIYVYICVCVYIYVYVSLPFPSAQPSEDHAPFREEPSRNGCIYSGQLHSYSCDAFQPACIHPQSLWGGGSGGARHAYLLPNEGEKCIARPSTFASVSASRCCSACRCTHHFDSCCGGHLRCAMYAQLVFLALFTGVLNAIACECRRGMEARGFQLDCGWRSFPTWGIRLGQRKWKYLLSFYRGLMCMCCVCVYALAHTHTLLGCEHKSRYDTWWARKKFRRAVVMAYEAYIPYRFRLNAQRKHVCTHVGFSCG